MSKKQKVLLIEVGIIVITGITAFFINKELSATNDLIATLLGISIGYFFTSMWFSAEQLDGFDGLKVSFDLLKSDFASIVNFCTIFSKDDAKKEIKEQIETCSKIIFLTSTATGYFRDYQDDLKARIDSKIKKETIFLVLDPTSEKFNNIIKNYTWYQSPSDIQIPVELSLEEKESLNDIDKKFSGSKKDKEHQNHFKEKYNEIVQILKVRPDTGIDFKIISKTPVDSLPPINCILAITEGNKNERFFAILKSPSDSQFDVTLELRELPSKNGGEKNNAVYEKYYRRFVHICKENNITW